MVSSDKFQGPQGRGASLGVGQTTQRVPPGPYLWATSCGHPLPRCWATLPGPRGLLILLIRAQSLAHKHVPGALVTTAPYPPNSALEDGFVAGTSSHFLDVLGTASRLHVLNVSYIKLTQSRH